MEFNFSLAPVFIPVLIDGKPYVLREVTEAGVCRWRDFQLKGARVVGDQYFNDNLHESEPFLVSQCLIELVSPDAPFPSPSSLLIERNGQPFGRLRLTSDFQPDEAHLVPLSQIRAWPARIVDPLFREVKRISELDAKTDQATTEQRFRETATALVSLSESKADREKWKSWMLDAVHQAVGTTSDLGPDPAKNGQRATPAISG